MTGFGLMGVSLSGSPTGDSAYTAWQNAVLPNPPYTGIQCRRVYYPGIPSGAYDTQIQICIDQGYKALVSFNPTLTGSRTSNNLPGLSQMQSDQTAMVTYLNTIVSAFTTAGMTPISKWLSVTMAHEPTNPGKPQTCTAAQFQNIYSTAASGGLTNYAALHAICPVWVDFLGNSQGATNAAAYFPTGFCDGVAVDYYAGNYGKGIDLTTFSNLADANGLPFSVWETGNTADGSLVSSTTVEQWLTFLASFCAGRITNSLLMGEFLWFQANGSSPGYNIISSSSDYRVPYLQALNAVLNTSAPPPPPPPPPSILPGPGGPVTITYGPPSALDAVLAASSTAQGSAWPTGLQAQNVALSQLIGTMLMPNPDVIPSTLLLQGTPPLQLPGGTAGWVLTSDGSGNLTLAAPTGGLSSVSAGDASIAASTTSGAVTLTAGTLDQIANLHPPAANWSNNSHKITNLANGSAAQDAVAFGQLAFTNQLAFVATQTANFTAAANTFVPCNTTGGTFTVTLPTAPATQTVICIQIVQGANPLTIACGGTDVLYVSGGATSLTLPGAPQAILLQYRSAGGIWNALGSYTQPHMALLAATAVAGYSKVNGTGTIISYTFPSDGQQHRFMVLASETVATAETGGAIGTTHTAPGGGSQVGSTNIFAGAKATGTYHASDGATAEAGTTVSVTQTSALTAGASTVWVELWGS